MVRRYGASRRPVRSPRHPRLRTDGCSSVHSGPATGRRCLRSTQRTGDLVWRSTGGGIISSPAVARGAVYVGSGDGNLYVVDATSGDQLWRFRTEIGIGSSPVVEDGVVYFLSGLTFFAVKAPS